VYVLTKYWATIISNRIKMSTFVPWICCTSSPSQKLLMDHLTKEQRHKNMAANKGKGTKLEIMFGKFLWNAGIRYCKNDKSVFGKPDFVIRGSKIAIFCDGEFWHGRNWDIRKNEHKSNCEFWHSKIARNIERDKEVNEELRKQGWKVFRFWETEITTNPDVCLNEVLNYMNRKSTTDDKIAITKMCGGGKVSMQMYGPHSLNEDGSIIPFEEQMAIVSHYLHNQGYKYAKPYEVKAEGLIEDIYNIHQKKSDTQCVLDVCVQYSLFSDLFYPIVMILRQEKNGKFNYKLHDKDVVIQTPEGDELLRTPASVFLVEAENLLKAINESEGAFPIPQIESFMNRIYCHSLKAKSSDKTDIRIILHDRRTKINSEMGFSIKSQLGGDSTLLNASKATNFNFKIDGASLSDGDIAKINSLSPTRNKVIERFKAITKKGGKLIFDKVDNSTFRNNLIMLDGDLPTIIAHLLLEQLNNGVSTLKELADYITQTNPLGYDTEQASPFYAYKIKHLLTSAALGMMPATAWSGKFDANGGYLVVKKDGEILCYHFYDRNRFEDYLFSNAYLERSSTSRHEYASIIKENDGTLSFKLNFQVRLK
jgi:DNA mismatch endonuclease Vsr